MRLTVWTEKSPIRLPNDSLEGDSLLRVVAAFLRNAKWRVFFLSLALALPCFWHRRIEAGDLPSHVYNAWLAQLIQKGQAPGLYLAKQWNNILFDLALQKTANFLGLALAEKIVVYACALIFFWGAFALVAAISQRVPWYWLPCLAMLTYGWTFNVGFFNYYLSLGFSFFALAIVWQGKGLALFAALPFAALALFAHPQGFLWLAGAAVYLLVSPRLPRYWKLVLPVVAVIGVFAVRIYLFKHFEAYSVVDDVGPGLYIGADQIALYSLRSFVLSSIALFFGVALFALSILRGEISANEFWQRLRIPLELYALVVLAVYALPDSVRIPLYNGWVGVMALRLTTMAAILGLGIVACIKPKLWHTAAFSVIAIVFFVFLYGDTATLNRMELQVERLVRDLPTGSRVLASIWAPSDSRLPYVVHIVDRACAGKCFSYSNYEPSSGQFRVRIDKDGSPLVTNDPDDSEAMQSGEYVVDSDILPAWQIYQCNPSDLTQLCIRSLSAGEPNNRIGYRPPRP